MKVDLSSPLVVGCLAFVVLVIIYLLIRFIRYLWNTKEEVTVGDANVGDANVGNAIEELSESVPELEEMVPPPPNPKQMKPFKKKSALKITTEK